MNTLIPGPSICRLWSWSFGVRPGVFISSGFSEESDATHPHTDLGNCWPRDCISEQQLGLLVSLLRQTCQAARADWTDHGLKITLRGEWWWYVSSLGPVFLISSVPFLRSGCNRFWKESFSFIVEIITKWIWGPCHSASGLLMARARDFIGDQMTNFTELLHMDLWCIPSPCLLVFTMLHANCMLQVTVYLCGVSRWLAFCPTEFRAFSWGKTTQSSRN